jgi:hypothetical protein
MQYFRSGCPGIRLLASLILTYWTSTLNPTQAGGRQMMSYFEIIQSGDFSAAVNTTTSFPYPTNYMNPCCDGEGEGEVCQRQSPSTIEREYSLFCDCSEFLSWLKLGNMVKRSSSFGA